MKTALPAALLALLLATVGSASAGILPLHDVEVGVRALGHDVRATVGSGGVGVTLDDQALPPARPEEPEVPPEQGATSVGAPGAPADASAGWMAWALLAVLAAAVVLLLVALRPRAPRRAAADPTSASLERDFWRARARWEEERVMRLAVANERLRRVAPPEAAPAAPSP